MTGTATREWSSTKLNTFTSPVAITQSMASICHHSFGADASNRRHDDFGRFTGRGTTDPRRTRIRWIVATDGTRGRQLNACAPEVPLDRRGAVVEPGISELLA